MSQQVRVGLRLHRHPRRSRSAHHIDWLTPPRDRSTGNREPDWNGASPIALLA
jgi:hypothetical protein